MNLGHKFNFKFKSKCLQPTFMCVCIRICVCMTKWSKFKIRPKLNFQKTLSSHYVPGIVE